MQILHLQTRTSIYRSCRRPCTFCIRVAAVHELCSSCGYVFEAQNPNIWIRAIVARATRAQCVLAKQGVAASTPIVAKATPSDRRKITLPMAALRTSLSHSIIDVKHCLQARRRRYAQSAGARQKSQLHLQTIKVCVQ